MNAIRVLGLITTCLCHMHEKGKFLTRAGVAGVLGEAAACFFRGVSMSPRSAHAAFEPKDPFPFRHSACNLFMGFLKKLQCAHGAFSPKDSLKAKQRTLSH